MSGRYSTGSIAGVALVQNGINARIDVIDGEGLKGALVGSSIIALDFSVHTQVSSRGVKGTRFGVRVTYMPISLLNSIVAACEAAMGAGLDFAVILADQSGVNKADNINVYCVPDFAAQGGKYYTRGALSGDYVRDCQFRFVTTRAG
ncbi:MAG: hypothetical protein M3458_05330 [Acidobacteriota bacterium]|nr:hypothetical protein [Acidobacteriota bacterium]